MPIQPRTAVEGLAFPALPPPAAARLLALQFQLGQSEWWSPAEIRAAQLQQVALVLRHAWQYVPFYRDRLAAAGYDPAVPLTAEFFASLPLLTRPQIQQAGSLLHSTQMPPGHGPTRSGETSGSTGRPITYLTSQSEGMYWHAFTLREHLWHGRDLGAKLGAIRYGKADGSTVGWGPSTNMVYMTGSGSILRIDTPVAGQVDWLVREQPDYLLSYPSNIDGLARECMRRGVRWPGLREVRTVAETVRPELRALVRAAWGVKVVDMYSASETGYLALQCPRHEHYHAQEESALIEILDDAGRPCAPGVEGRVVVTTLHKFAMPLIRYEIGDYAVPGPPCDCGRGLAVIQRLLGRTRNLVQLPDGSKRWPLCELVGQPDVPGILQYQFVQRSLQHIDVYLVVGPEYSQSMEPRLTEIIHQRLGCPFGLSYHYCDIIPRSANGKFEDFRCEVVES